MNISATELPNFIGKYYLLHELLISKYWRQKHFSFQYSVTYCGQALRRPAQRARETVHLLSHETPDFITPALWPANNPDLNPVDYQIWRSCRRQKRVYRSQIRDVHQLKSRLIEEWEHFHQVVIDEAVRLWRPRLWASDADREYLRKESRRPKSERHVIESDSCCEWSPINFGPPTR